MIRENILRLNGEDQIEGHAPYIRNLVLKEFLLNNAVKNNKLFKYLDFDYDDEFIVKNIFTG